MALVVKQYIPLSTSALLAVARRPGMSLSYYADVLQLTCLRTHQAFLRLSDEKKGNEYGLVKFVPHEKFALYTYVLTMRGEEAVGILKSHLKPLVGVR